MQTFTIDGTQVPQLPDYQTVTAAASPITNETETEGGTIVREVIRSKRRVLHARWTLSEAYLKTLYDLVMKDSITVTTYMPELGADGSMTCYVSEFEPKVISGGKRWSVELDFKEF